MAYDRIFEISDDSFTVKTTVGSVTLRKFKSAEECDEYLADIKYPHTHRCPVSWNTEVATITALNLWKAHLAEQAKLSEAA